MVQFSHTYMTTGKTMALIIQTLVSTVMSLIFNSLCRFATAFPNVLKRHQKSLLFPKGTNFTPSLNRATVSLGAPGACKASPNSTKGPRAASQARLSPVFPVISKGCCKDRPSPHHIPDVHIVQCDDIQGFFGCWSVCSLPQSTFLVLHQGLHGGKNLLKGRQLRLLEDTASKILSQLSCLSVVLALQTVSN